MAHHNKVGQRGEILARHYLEREGYQILETNWRYGKAEVDIIAKQEEVLVFVEVKTRSSHHFAAPEEAMDMQKEILLADAAGVYMEQVQHEWEIRFDVISIVLEEEGSYHITHYEDAFFPGMDPTD